MILGIWGTLEVILALILVLAPRLGDDYKAGYKAEFEMGVAGFAAISAVWTLFMLALNLIF